MVASTGLAAILLELGRTFHSRFNAPLDAGCGTVFDIKKQSVLADMLRETELIIWDEAGMHSRYYLEALDLTLRDLCTSEKPFAGKVVLLAADFRQTIPIKKRASKGQLVDLVHKQSKLWEYFGKHVYKFNVNRRVRAATSPEDAKRLEEFVAWQLRIGDGVEGDEHGNVDLPQEMCLPPDPDHLLDCVYNDVAEQLGKDEDAVCTWLAARAILTPRNMDADVLNERVLDRISGDTVDCFSADRVVDDGSSDNAVPEENLNSLNPPRCPPHRLRLKPRCVLILLRNLNPSAGLCNGTRLMFRQAISYGDQRLQALECVILNGSHSGNVVFLPRIRLDINERLIAHDWTRCQFPVRLAFVLTINKSQGQSFEFVGVYLPNPVFQHGQLYVAASRAIDPESIKFCIGHTGAATFVCCRTKNVVYKELFS